MQEQEAGTGADLGLEARYSDKGCRCFSGILAVNLNICPFLTNLNRGTRLRNFVEKVFAEVSANLGFKDAHYFFVCMAEKLRLVHGSQHMV